MLDVVADSNIALHFYPQQFHEAKIGIILKELSEVILLNSLDDNFSCCELMYLFFLLFFF